MATESLPSSGALSTVNRVTASSAQIVSVTEEATFFPKSNLLSPLRSETVRSVTTGQWSVIIDLGAAYLIDLFALINHNTAGGQAVVLKGATDAGITTSVLTWSWQSYNAADRKLNRWYMGADDAATANAAKRYWQVILPASGTGTDPLTGIAYAYHEVGGIWLGSRTALEVSAPFQRRSSNASRRSQADNGARHVDPLPSGREFELQTTQHDAGVLLPIESQLEAAGAGTHILLDISASETDLARKAQSTYYGTLDPRGTQVVFPDHSLAGELRIGLDEAIA